MRHVHEDAFEQFDKTFPKEVTDLWLQEVLAWDADRRAPNPYVEPKQVASVAALKLELAKEEAADMERGIFRSQDKSVSTFLNNALELQEEQ